MRVGSVDLNNNWSSMRHLILDLLSDGELYTRKEIKSFVESKMGSDFNIHSLSTCLYDLKKKETIESPKRACYVVANSRKQNLATKSHKILSSTLEELRKAASTIDIFNMSENDKRTITLLKDMIKHMEKTTIKLEKMI